MNIWRNYMSKGNERFEAEDYESAVVLYEAACKQAKSLFIHWREPDEATSALIVSYLNLADLHQTWGRVNLARQKLEKIHNFMLRAVASTPINDKRHSALYRGSIETYEALIAHKRKNPTARTGIKQKAVD